MRHPLRTLATLAAAAVTAVVAPVAAAAPGDPGQRDLGTASTVTSITGVPKSCYSFSTFLDGRRGYGEVIVRDSQVGFFQPVSETGRLSYVPRAHVAREVSGTGPWTMRGWSVTDAGTFQRWTRTFSTTQRVRTYRATLAGGWTDVRALGTSRDHVYVVRGDRLLRYTVTDTGGVAAPVTIGTGYGNIKTLSFVTSDAWTDTFAATSRGGSLQALKFSRANPTSVQRKVVRSSGFAGFVSASSGNCAGSGQVLLAVSGTGRIYTYYDADGWWGNASTPSGRLATRATIPVKTYSN